MAESHGKTKITEDYLRDFATQKVEKFLENVTAEPHRIELSNYTQDGKLGADVNWNYNQLLPGNAKANFTEATRLQSTFKTFATALDQRFTAIETAARTLMEDLLMVDAVLTKGEDDADITAAEMTADLSNVTFDSGSGGTNPPSGSGNNGNS
jgi:hypothetical protein